METYHILDPELTVDIDEKGNVTFHVSGIKVKQLPPEFDKKEV